MHDERKHYLSAGRRHVVGMGYDILFYCIISCEYKKKLFKASVQILIA